MKIKIFTKLNLNIFKIKTKKNPVKIKALKPSTNNKK